jgi:hypothetical protein
MMRTYPPVNFYSRTNKTRFEELTPTQRELVVAFTCPNGEAVSNEGLTLFFSLMDMGTIEFAQVGTPNEHLHVPHLPTAAERFCTVCAYITELVAA